MLDMISLAPGLWECSDGTYYVHPAELLPACGCFYDAGAVADLEVVIAQLLADLGFKGVRRFWIIDPAQN